MEKENNQANCISRRDFLQGLAGSSVAVVLVPGFAGETAGGQKPTEAELKVRFSRCTVPILRSGDVIIVGGSFAAVAAALEFAQAGKQVVLVESRTYLGREITASLRPWVNLGRLASKGRVPELVAACLEAAAAGNAVSDEIPLKPDMVKLSLENQLLNAGVELIYASQPVGVVVENETVIGIIIGNKSGRQVIIGKVVIDATETAAVARAAGAEFEDETPEMFRFSRTIEFDGVGPFKNNSISVPNSLAMAGNTVSTHRGYRGESHIYVECPMVLRYGSMDVAGSMQREIEARHRSMRLASHLINNVPQFKKAFLAASSYELHGRHTTCLTVTQPEWVSAFDSVRLAFTGKDLENVQLPVSRFASALRHLWCLQEAARLERQHITLFSDPVSAAVVGAAFAKNLIAQWDQISSFLPSGKSTLNSRQTGRSSGAMDIRQQESPQLGRSYEQQVVGQSEVPVIRTADVLVVGGGTSGATAAITSSRKGMHTVLVELNPGLGGTGTLGGVDSYWFGRRVGFNARVRQLVQNVHKSLNYRGRRWNIEAKMYALLKEAERVDVEVFFNVITIGAVVEKNRLRGVIVATKFGVFAIIAKVVIDATGDGDVAAFAGAKYTYGSARDHVAMWYSLAQFTRPGRTRNNFTSMVDVSNIEDYTRAILVGRRRGDNCHDHGIYIASRETRHIKGDVVLTLTDELRQKRWPDVVNIHFSNYDIKGKSGSDWLRMGLIPPNLQIEIPYRALLPEGLDNILVAGKAISATHDALPSIRMQADLENLGGVVALAAAQTVREGVCPRGINVAALQKRLVKSGVLPEKVLKRKIRQREYNTAEQKALVESFSADKPLHSYSDMKDSEVFREIIPIVEVCSSGAPAPAILKQALLSARGNLRIRLAQALAVYGLSAGAATLIAEIERYLANGTLPPRTSQIRNAGLPPDQGAMPDVVYLMYSLGMTRDKRSLIIWDKVAGLLSVTEEDFKDPFKGTFYYVDAVCYGAELLGDTKTIHTLNKIHAQRCLRDLVVEDELQVDFMHERRALLELGIGRALARCGSTDGVEILISYLNDNRALLAEFAHTTLVSVTGEDYGKDTTAWSTWLVEGKNSFKPCPLLERPHE